MSILYWGVRVLQLLILSSNPQSTGYNYSYYPVIHRAQALALPATCPQPTQPTHQLNPQMWMRITHPILTHALLPSHKNSQFCVRVWAFSAVNFFNSSYILLLLHLVSKLALHSNLKTTSGKFDKFPSSEDRLMSGIFIQQFSGRAAFSAATHQANDWGSSNSVDDHDVKVSNMGVFWCGCTMEWRRVQCDYLVWAYLCGLVQPGRKQIHSTAKPHVSSTAQVNLDRNFSYVSYGGMSSRLKLQVNTVF
jgi:hypothetical protein